MIEIYKIIGNNNIFNVLDTVIENRKIKNKSKFLSPSKLDILSPYLLKNMNLAIQMFKKHIKKGSVVAVLIDSDP